MPNLKQYFNLQHNIKLYVPSTTDIDQEADTEKYLKQVIRDFSIWFGGATTTEAIGGWYSQDLEKVVTEKVTIVTSFSTTEAIEKNIAKVLELANKIKKELKQEAVSLEYDNKLYFI